MTSTATTDMETKLTPNEIIVLAAWFAVSNLGQPRPSRTEVAKALSRNNVSIEGAVIEFARQYMENEKHYQMFVEEAQSWMETIAKQYRNREAIVSVWPYVQEYFWPKDAENV